MEQNSRAVRTNRTGKKNMAPAFELESVCFLNICKKQMDKAEKQGMEKAKKRTKATGLL